jgi:phospholipase/lecithinase/hemolysin
MATPANPYFSRRRLLGASAASAAAGLLAACGSGTIDSALKPGRVISFGDGMSDVGQTGAGASYSVNDGNTNVWVKQLALSYGITLTAQTQGGFGYAQGNARIVAMPDAAGSTSTLTTQQQIDKFLASNTFAANDLVVVSGGLSDIIVEMAKVTAGTQTSAQMVANVGQAGVDYAAQITRLVQSGAKYVVAAGVYNLARSPWAVNSGQTTLLGSAAAKFNEQLLVNIVNLGANVLYADAAYYFNLFTGSPASYNLTDASSIACNSIDPGPGIGIGAGQVNAVRCNPATIGEGLDYTRLAFADAVHFTPVGHVLFGNYIFSRLRARW